MIISSDVGRPLLSVQMKASVQARAFVPIDMVLDTSGAADGVRLPLEVIISGPTQTQTRTINRYIPKCLTATPRESGEHVVVVRETGHDHAYGLLKLQVSDT